MCTQIDKDKIDLWLTQQWRMKNVHTCESMSCENLSMAEMSIGLTYKTNQRDWDKSVFDPQDLITDQR